MLRFLEVIQDLVVSVKVIEEDQYVTTLCELVCPIYSLGCQLTLSESIISISVCIYVCLVNFC